LRVEVRIFDENSGRRVYSIHKPSDDGYFDSETRLFLDSHIGGDYNQNAIDLEQRIDLMVNTRVGFQERFFRPEGTMTNREGLKGLPELEEKGIRLRLYGYRISNSLLLIGGGCLKLHDETNNRTSLDGFPECSKSANLIKGVSDAIKTLKRMNRLIEKNDGYYGADEKIKNDFFVTVPDALK